MARDDINNLEIYQLAMSCGEITYSLILTWNQFNKNTIGYQLVRACDSIAANISEGYGRNHFKEQRQLCYIARGSLYETKTWISKAIERIPEYQSEMSELMLQLEQLARKLNAYIGYINKNIKS